MNEQVLVTLLQQLASSGVVGTFAIIVLLGYKAKDKKLDDERAARIDDAKANTAAMLEIQQQVVTAVNKLSQIVDVFETREEERSRRGPETVIVEGRITQASRRKGT